MTGDGDPGFELLLSGRSLFSQEGHILISNLQKGILGTELKWECTAKGFHLSLTVRNLGLGKGCLTVHIISSAIKSGVSIMNDLERSPLYFAVTVVGLGTKLVTAEKMLANLANSISYTSYCVSPAHNFCPITATLSAHLLSFFLLRYQDLYNK